MKDYPLDQKKQVFGDRRTKRQRARGDAERAAMEAERAAESPSEGVAYPCPVCGAQTRPEHAHERCDDCGYRGACCW